jgi:hypothetical protein
MAIGRHSPPLHSGRHCFSVKNEGLSRDGSQIFKNHVGTLPSPDFCTPPVATTADSLRSPWRIGQMFLTATSPAPAQSLLTNQSAPRDHSIHGCRSHSGPRQPCRATRVLTATTATKRHIARPGDAAIRRNGSKIIRLKLVG